MPRKAGFHHSEETIRKMSLAKKGKPKSEKHKENIRLANLGKKLSLEVRAKISAALKGRKLSEEQKEKLRMVSKGRGLGRTLPLWVKIKMRQSAKRGPLNNFWRHGRYKDVYPEEFYRMKYDVYKRDHFICRECGIPKSERRLECHHIDHDKSNNFSTNLITLCKTCHNKAHTTRGDWINRYQQMTEYVGVAI